MSGQDQSWFAGLHDVAGPKYRAIADALAAAIGDGRLAPGDRLPPHRELAARLGVDLTTVTRAYGEARDRGLIEAGGRRGSFVRARPAGPAADDAAAARLAGEAGVDLTMNMPPQPASLAPRLAAAYAALLAEPRAGLRLHYQDSAGAWADRQGGATLLGRRLPGAAAERVAVAPGGQAALAALLPLAWSPGDTVCAPAFTYPGFATVARRLGLRILPLPMDEGGVDPDAFAAACLAGGVGGLYLVPTNDNPTTATLAEDRRRAIAAAARRHGVVVIEDDAYGFLAAAAPAPLAAHAPERTWQIASVAKALTPALRVAYVHAPTARDAARLGEALHGAAVMAPPLNAAVVSRLVADGGFDAVVADVRAAAAARRALATELLGGDRFEAHPDGYHLWLRLPPGAGPATLAAAARAGLPLAAGEAFAIDPAAAPDRARLSLGGPAGHEALVQGLSALAALIDRADRPAATLV